MKKYDLEPSRENLLRTYKENSIGRNADLIHFIAILDAIEDGCSIALDGNWGSGKTFFVKQAKMVMDAYNEYIKSCTEDDRNIIKSVQTETSVIDLSKIQPQVCVYYDAWENDNDDDPILSLVYTILNGADEDFSFREHSFLEIAAGLMQTFTGRDWKQIVDGLKGKDPLEGLKQSKHIETLVAEFLKSLLPEHGNRLVVFIDELDRCKPSYAVRLLERIKHYFSNNQITFVFSVNTNELQHTIRKYYGNDFNASRYLDRFFDLRVALSLPDMERFYRSISFDGTSYTYDMVCSAVIKAYHFELREVARYLRLARIAAYEPTHSEKYPFTFPDGRALQFALHCIVPIMLGLKVSDVERYNDFIEGRDYTPLLELAKVLGVRYFEELLTKDETFDEEEESKTVTVVKLETKLQDVYEAIFGASYTGRVYSKTVGQFSFDARTKGKLLKIVGLTSQCTKIDS